MWWQHQVCRRSELHVTVSLMSAVTSSHTFSYIYDLFKGYWTLQHWPHSFHFDMLILGPLSSIFFIPSNLFMTQFINNSPALLVGICKYNFPFLRKIFYGPKEKGDGPKPHSGCASVPSDTGSCDMPVTHWALIQHWNSLRCSFPNFILGLLLPAFLSDIQNQHNAWYVAVHSSVTAFIIKATLSFVRTRLR